ncbi:TPA: hypothetical protein HA265_07270 [Candidatus Woesearchaeota archaeon]|nr:hypothetical protein [Candidatus Woesearchaeota archaeon]
MFDVKIYETYVSAERELEDIVEVNNIEIAGISEENQRPSPDYSRFTMRPLIELRTDGNEYWFWDNTRDLEGPEDEEVDVFDDIGELAMAVVKYIHETKAEAPGLRLFPRIYTVSEEKGVKDYAEDQFSHSPTEELIHIQVDSTAEDLASALEAYATAQQNRTEAITPAADVSDDEEEEYSRGLDKTEAREFIVYTRPLRDM